ncbi:CYTH domain-containing protein [Marinomonas balearica]|uniref:CYTH domain-containing protein n=1 Tax=Marinomonas balearica TaxID=491947 RepID=A0A4R6MG65_9GAMM|nr:CYTH domain-containing protein [Marinomonas balearica]TDP00497.1 CYTH domain-containing protein [Marinomonas balearica]
MATELELKLMVQPEHQTKVCLFLDEFCSDGAENQHFRRPTLSLMNAYYDTPEATLLNAGIALRIRAVDGRFIQTVKTRGSSRVGMHERGEWEWDVPTDSLDLSLLKEVPLPEELKDLSWSKDIVEVFRTDFERQIWDIQYNGTEIEVACDNGDVTSPYGRDQISEVELELKTGNGEDLYSFALVLCDKLPLQVNLVSKAQKGARLKNRKIEFPDTPSANSTNLEFAVYWYETWITYWEAMFYLQDEILIQPVRNSMLQLKKCLSDELHNELDELDRSLSDAMNADNDNVLEALAKVEHTGKVMLHIGLWLNQQIQF